MMKLHDLLLQKRPAILEKWFQAALETYPADTSRFLRREKDRFANPVGHAISYGMEGLLDQLFDGNDSAKVSSLLDDIVRIRAVQDFSPSQAIGFIFTLKRIIRDVLQSEIRSGNASAEELFALEARIDSMALASFDIYMGCRETIYELKATQVKNATLKLLERTNLLTEMPEHEPDSNDDSDGK
ncbi:MAG: hypothetical protein C4532_14220 [Candidatus Abyssobacteria bacterium SURF_17]|uniref:RsbT co-antagonist protein RsbRD N-terminal domain-containing protein n=1 Tax=Candidatus Abyssobacteria bacterium SURF_17 TaxID=2093361 RepID=A0A419EU69_9BACT|nr:MAG: hypothetical protein C4532_14220 [Candidatus Abyssubacteria bacterium SURF_17]